jgi:hypothetical protein
MRLKIFGMLAILALLVAVRYWPADQPRYHSQSTFDISKMLRLVCGIPLLALGVLAVLALLIAAFLGYHQFRYIQAMRTSEIRKSQAEEPQVIQSAVLGTTIVYPDHSIRMLEMGIVLEPDGALRSAIPQLAGPEQRRRLLLAGGGWPTRETATLLQEPVNTQWPTEVPLRSVVAEPDIKNLVLGVTFDADGQRQVVKADMGKLVHIAIGGSSGWGKSVCLRSLGYQLALSQSPVEMAMVDLEGATLAPFARCARLLYPIAETERDALAIFQALLDELEQRKALYADYPGVDSLDAYNAMADRPLTPLVALIDEATALLGDKSVESVLRTLALRARKYGLWLVLAGQDWKANTLDTAIRNQLSSRIQFKAMAAGQSRTLLGCGDAEDLNAIGRAFAILPGRDMFMMHSPIVSARTILADVSDGGPREPTPVMAGNDSDEAARIRKLAAQGMGPSSIAKEVYGSSGGSAYYKVKDVLKDIDD